MTTLAASTGGQILGSIGTAGVGLILAIWFVLGTRAKSRHPLKQGPALTMCLVAGTVWMASGQIWGIPNDLIQPLLTGLIGSKMMGDVGMGAAAIALVLIAYLVEMKARYAGYLGLVMASTFSLAGGAWAMVTTSAAVAVTGWAS
jgi:hypothetical protein